MAASFMEGVCIPTKQSIFKWKKVGPGSMMLGAGISYMRAIPHNTKYISYLLYIPQ